MREEFYPVRAAAFDTDEGIRQELELNWGWLPKNEVVILSGVRDEDLNAIIENILPGKAGETERWFGRGIGGLPFLGRYAARTALESDSYGEKSAITEGLQSKGFGAGGILLTINSLTGGTGSGFAGPVTKYLVNDVMGGSARVVLNLSIIPSGKDVDQIHPRNILAGLYYLLMSNLPDGIIIADNDQMSNIQ